MVTTKSYDFLNRLSAISSAPSAGSTVSYSYTYNAANQRVRSQLADGSSWQFIYDSLGQVVSGHKFFADETPVAGQQFDYTFDNIGNRTQTLAGGDQSGLNQRLATYGANNLNQYTNRSIPGYVDVMGIALATNSVTVGGQTAYRKGEYFRNQLPVSNGSAAIWTNVTVSSPAQTSISGNAFVPQTPETYSYDADGNLTADGRWSYTWDGENRLISLQGQSSIPTGAKFKVDMVYDSQGRRIQKLVSTNNGSAYFPQYTNRFVYDGWNLLANLNPQSSVMQSFVWGLDLSGSSQGAGGVGGLLALNDSVNGMMFAGYDGNGNVAELTKAADGTIAAQYEYGPFGEVIRATGPMAKANPFRFSGKYQDDEIDLVYYGFRYHNTSTGRWNGRDPLREQGGVNLYGFTRNDPVGRIDNLGLDGLGTVGTANPQNTAPAVELLEEAEGVTRRIPVPFPPYLPLRSKCKQCCTCVNSLQIKNISPLNNAPFVGNEFDVVAELENVVTTPQNAGSATLIWKEKSNRPPSFYDEPPNKWVDLADKFPGYHIFDNWFQTKIPCPGAASINIHDAPEGLYL